jgi:hypothetical protein
MVAKALAVGCLELKESELEPLKQPKAYDVNSLL